MENLLEPIPVNLEDALPLVTPLYGRINAVLMNCYKETEYAKDQQIQRGVICPMTPKTKGGIMSDALQHFLEEEFSDVQNAYVVNIKGVVGLVIDDKVFVKFNKMDESHSPSIQQRQWYKTITNQGVEIEGLPKAIIKMWAGIVPLDKEWSAVARCSLVYYEGGNVAWYSNLTDTTVQQLTINIHQPIQKKRATPKKKDGDQDAKTGTENP